MPHYLGLRNLVQLLCALDYALDLRYLDSGAALSNLVHGLAIPCQRALAGLLPPETFFGRMAPAQNHIVINDHVCPLHLSGESAIFF